MNYLIPSSPLGRWPTLLLATLLISLSACEAESEPPASQSPSPKAVEQASSQREERAAVQEAATQTEGAKGTTSYQAGKHYLVLENPVATVDPGRVEVNEIFWYGCSHCFVFEPLLEAWKSTIEDDVVLVRTPANWHPVMELHARAFYTAKALKVLDKVHQPIFEAINVDKQKLAREKDIAALFAKFTTVEAENFSKTFNSFGVNSAVRQADSRQRAYQIAGTPEMIVNGKYRVTAQLAGGHKGMLAVVDHLVEQERPTLQAASSQQAADE